jgi:hypothetical protein
MDITVNINAPAIVDAINKLTNALGSGLLKSAQLTTAGDASIALTAEPIAIQTTQGTPTAPVQPVQAVESNVTAPAPVMAQSVAQPTQSALVQQATPAPTPVQQTAPAPAPTAPAPVVDEAYRNRVCTGAARLVEQGKMSEVLNILQSFGVPSVVHLTAEQLPEFANQITALGAVI